MKNKLTIIITMMTLLLIFLSTIVTSEIIIETYSIEFYTSANSQPELCLCGEINDEITIRNNAPYPQVFDLTTNLDRANIAVNQITLNPKQEIKIPILLTAKCDEKEKTENYDVIIKSTTGAQQIISRNLEIKKCQTIQAKLHAEKNTTNICEPQEYYILLENPSTFEETYLIGPEKNVEWFNYKGYEVTLKPQQTSILNFTFNPSCDIHGDIDNIFRIEAQKSNLNVELIHNFYIKPGYNFTAYGLEELNLCRYEKIQIPYNITNQGLINNTYELELKNNPSFVNLQEKTITIKPNETKTIYLEIEPESKTDNQYDFELIIKTTIGNEQITKKIILNLENCYEAKLQIKDPESLSVCQGIQELQLLIINEGTKIETYNLETNTQTAILSDNKVTLEPEEQKTITLTINSSIFNQKILFKVTANSTRNLSKNWEDTILLDIISSEECSKITFPKRYNIYSRYHEEQINITVKNTGIQGETYNIRYFGDDFLKLTNEQTYIESEQEYEVTLNKTKEHEKDEYYFTIEFITTTGEKYSKEYRLILTSTPITEKIINYAKENPCFLVTLILTTIIILYILSLLILGPYLNKILTTILSIIILILIIIALIINGLPQKINPTLEQPEDQYSFKIYEGENLKINLNDYVRDPDNDSLKFTIADEPSYINLELENNTINIQSNNWTGNDRFRILADDERGGVIVTPRFNIEVIEKKKLTDKEKYEFYCVYINIIILLILLIVLLITTKTNKKQENNKNKQETQNKKTTKNTTTTKKTKTKTKSTKKTKKKKTKK